MQFLYGYIFLKRNGRNFYYHTSIFLSTLQKILRNTSILKVLYNLIHFYPFLANLSFSLDTKVNNLDFLRARRCCTCLSAWRSFNIRISSASVRSVEWAMTLFSSLFVSFVDFFIFILLNSILAYGKPSRSSVLQSAPNRAVGTLIVA